MKYEVRFYNEKGHSVYPSMWRKFDTRTEAKRYGERKTAR